MGSMRILSTGFLEILLSAVIGLGIFNLGHFTAVDTITASVNVAYLVALAIYVLFAIWFFILKAKVLIEIKNTRDTLEHLQILKLIGDSRKALQDSIARSLLMTSQASL